MLKYCAERSEVDVVGVIEVEVFVIDTKKHGMLANCLGAIGEHGT
jgi:hypothetical protein